MTDDQFLSDFEAGALREFHHRDHIRLAWLRVKESGAAAEGRVAGDIQAFAARAGASRKYHETITQFWVKLVSHADEAFRPADVDELTSRCPLLLDQSALLRHWSQPALMSDTARARWLEPDLVALPF